MHGWKNISEKYCRFMTVIIPSTPVKVAATAEALEPTKIPVLTD